jgi:hypothetical protein
MKRISVGFAVTSLIGTMYAFASLFTGLTDFGIGMGVAILGLLGFIVAVEN